MAFKYLPIVHILPIIYYYYRYRWHATVVRHYWLFALDYEIAIMSIDSLIKNNTNLFACLRAACIVIFPAIINNKNSIFVNVVVVGHINVLSLYTFDISFRRSPTSIIVHDEQAREYIYYYNIIMTIRTYVLMFLRVIDVKKRTPQCV